MWENIPVWVLLTAITVFSFLVIELGFRLADGRRRAGIQEPQAPIGAVIAATLGLLAFLLAFTFNIAAARFDERRLSVLNEANAIGTTYLRADFLGEPAKGRIKQLLREYVHWRATMPNSDNDVNQVMSRSEKLQSQMWSQSTADSLYRL